MDTRSTIIEQEPPGPPSDVGQVLLVMSSDYFVTLPLPPSSVLTIGRSTRADIHIDDPIVSREHARLHVADQVRIEDLGSANGTRVSNQNITARSLVPVVPGEAITIGNTVLMVQKSASSVVERACARGNSRLPSEVKQPMTVPTRFMAPAM